MFLTSFFKNWPLIHDNIFFFFSQTKTTSSWPKRTKKVKGGHNYIFLPVHISLCGIFMILVSHENVKKCVWDGCTITSKTKIKVYWKIFAPLRSKKKLKKRMQFQMCVGALCCLVSFSRDNALFASKDKISKNIDFSLWGNRATTKNTVFDIFMWDQNHENHT